VSVLQNLAFNNTFHAMGERFYSEVSPQGLERPSLVSASPMVAQLLGLDPAVFQSQDFIRYFSGNDVLPGSKPLAMVYSGHQFGSYNPQLGDGRALLLGELEGPNGRWDLNLKGAGVTPYSRSGDGRAVLRSSIREYLCSEAMAGLGIPTTRALCIIRGEDAIWREQIEPSATVVRVSESHIRFGSFEYFFHQGMHQQLQQLADYVIEHHFPALQNSPDKYAEFFTQVVKRTAELIAQWQAVGFAHGVMNTDNMSILGQTFDFGPYGFLDDYNPAFICNHSDYSGRYAFNQQPEIGLWNLNALAHALSPLLTREQLVEALQQYQGWFIDEYWLLMRSKLGLTETLPDDQRLLEELLTLMARQQVDYTIFFRRLCYFSEPLKNDSLTEMFRHDAQFLTWLKKYALRLEKQQGLTQVQRQQQMLAVNPKYILRNYMAQNAIDQAQQHADYSEVNRLLTLLYSPFDEHPDMENYAGFPPHWGKTLEISCSS
jgi:hypothetical protein